MSGLSDTSPEIAAMLVDIYRRMPPDQKWQQLRQMYRRARAFHATGVRLLNPHATDEDILAAWIRDQLHLPFEGLSPARATGANMTGTNDLQSVIDVFRRLGIAYALGGSMASSIYGESRHTNDADVAVEPFDGKEEALVAALGPNFYVALPSVREAVARRSSFNILNTASGFKMDVFVRKDRPFEASALARRIPMEFSDAPGRPVDVLSAEDVVLFKLEWYRLGGEVSDRQWKDIVSVLRIRGAQIDQAYLDRWAGDLGVADLLARARQESAAP
jgi:hypothetical protein